MPSNGLGIDAWKISLQLDRQASQAGFKEISSLLPGRLLSTKERMKKYYFQQIFFFLRPNNRRKFRGKFITDFVVCCSNHHNTPHILYSYSMAAIAAQRVMLAEKWEEGMDPTGWWMAEKLDGVRAYWSGSGFYSRQGNHFSGVPDFFMKYYSSFLFRSVPPNIGCHRDLPKTPLDGEVFPQSTKLDMPIDFLPSELTPSFLEF